MSQPIRLDAQLDGPVVEAKVKTSTAAAAAAGFVVSGGITFIVGWLTRHTPRALAEIDTE